MADFRELLQGLWRIPKLDAKFRQILGKPMALSFEERLQRANARLKDAQLGVAISLVGERLHLRAKLPPKPTSKRKDWHQQRLATGKPANGAGLDAAEKLAKRVAGELIAGTFDWENWQGHLSKRFQKPVLVGEWVKRYTKAHQGSLAASTWKSDYRNVFAQLPSDSALTAELLEQVIRSKPENSAQRKRFTQTLGRLAKFAGLDVDFRELRGNYSASAVSPRDIPSDEAIAQAVLAIKHPGWAWCIGMMATFGLRNHEVFFCDMQGLHAGANDVRIFSSKTGEHRAWAFHQEWIDLFNLRAPQLPFQQRYENHEDYGRRVSNWAYKHLAFSAYNLRHAWAVRTLLYGLPDSVAAGMMGHSTEVHQRTYQHWLGKAHQRQAYERVMGRGDRPQPPQLH